MARGIRWTIAAADDLESVVNYVAQDSPSRASAIARAAVDQSHRITQAPESGSIVPEFDDPTLREIIVKRSFRLIFRITPDACHVMAFLHHARDITRLVQNREFDL
ncbi:MAG: type II toxin-antitoxin system RelE/ParE family toxin [Planctomycetota bacterium]|nr:MAG: type II toxin-antitoxin system RelE/ParE family toxin [Planctomycetota bacterium]REJ88840.1 MAG: type II toxin-antitoxin system RelE/ParE family toxin [Planctomycetota bacterium]REK29456.1 MAG: type II toxin-antitoxin system RelE/ParE family toxin [Planctomycetota bacterium]REK31821.1 MAG: type II toxin-antitoxin system RelE/ParE family toxin [Planctomycetota bacterium]